LNIADELHLLRRQLEGASSPYRERAHKLHRLLDEVLEEPGLMG